MYDVYNVYICIVHSEQIKRPYNFIEEKKSHWESLKKHQKPAKYRTKTIYLPFRSWNVCVCVCKCASVSFCSDHRPAIFISAIREIVVWSIFFGAILRFTMLLQCTSQRFSFSRIPFYMLENRHFFPFEFQASCAISLGQVVSMASHRIGYRTVLYSWYEFRNIYTCPIFLCNFLRFLSADRSVFLGRQSIFL